jgi:hypothetical protein
VLYVNLQENSAILRIDIETASAKVVDGYSLKAWTSGNGIDIVEYDGCSLFVTNQALYSNRAPDDIATVDIDGVTYILTTDEGDDEKIEAGDLFNGGTLDQAGFTASSEFFDPNSTSEGFSAPFNSDCENTAIGIRLEKEGCDAYPYAHNSIKDEKFSLLKGPYWILEPDDREDLIEM